MRKVQGIFLISVMFVALVISMFAISALATAPGGLLRSQNQARRQAAERAIRSGFDYAIARIRATPGGLWRAENTELVQLNGLTVREQSGQVEGWIQDNERWSRFRITFNSQDGPGGIDGLADAPQALPGLELSCNNLPFNQELSVPAMRADGQADPQASTRLQLPPHTVLLTVEGSCGSASMAGNLPTFTSSPILVKAEMVLQLSTTDIQLYDSVASTTGNLNFLVQAGQNVAFQAVGAGQGRLRSKGGLSVKDSNNQGGSLTSPRGEIRTSNNGNEIGSTQAGPNIVRKQENAADALFAVALDSAPQPGAGAVEMPAGVYEVDLVNGQPQVKYYEMSYADYKAARLAGTLTGGNSITMDSSIHLNVMPRGDHDGVEVHFSQDATVKAVGALKGLAIVPSKGAFQEGETPAPVAGGGGVVVLQAQAQVTSTRSDVYLALLANKIQSELSSGLAPAPANEMTVPSSFSVNPAFGTLLQAYANGPNTINTFGPDIYFSGNTVTSMQYFPASWDGLPGIYNFQLGSLQLAQQMWTDLNPSRTAALEAFMGTPVPIGFGGATQPPDVGFNGVTDIPETLDDSDPATTTAATSGGLAVKDLKVRLEREGNSQDAVTLRGSGEVVLAGMLEGKGGAVVAQGDLSLLGNGLDLEASQGGASGINLYSAGNILVDGFAFDDSSSRYNNISLKGILYSWGDITVNAGKTGSSLSWGDFSLTGAMVAFGRDPANPSSAAQARNIDVTAHKTDLTFDPAYLFNLSQSPVNPNSRFVVRAYHQN